MPTHTSKASDNKGDDDDPEFYEDDDTDEKV